jgi:hypothetical protein
MAISTFYSTLVFDIASSKLRRLNGSCALGQYSASYYSGVNALAMAPDGYTLVVNGTLAHALGPMLRPKTAGYTVPEMSAVGIFSSSSNFFVQSSSSYYHLHLAHPIALLNGSINQKLSHVLHL